jgi:hypothetical protein
VEQGVIQNHLFLWQGGVCGGGVPGAFAELHHIRVLCFCVRLKAGHTKGHKPTA